MMSILQKMNNVISIRYTQVVLSFALLACFSLASTSSLQAQQIPVYSQYIFNPYLYNPAWTGIGVKGNVAVSHRSQWINMPDAPVTNTLTFEMPIYKLNIGVGGMLYSDRTHIIEKLGGMISYAYHLRLDSELDHKISAGVSAGLVNQRFDVTSATVQTANDAALFTENVRGFAPDVTVGLNYRYRKFNLGISVPQVANFNITYPTADTTSTPYTLVRHFLASTSYQFKATFAEQELDVRPVVLLRASQTLPLQVDVNVLAGWNETLWAGVGYRSSHQLQSGIYASVGLTIKNSLDIYYTYESSLNTLDRSSFGSSHEISIGYRFGDSRKVIERLQKELEALDKDVNQNTQDIDTLGRELRDRINTNTNDIDTLKSRVDTLEKGGSVRYFVDTSGAVPATVTYKKLGSIFFAQSSAELTDAEKSKINNVYDLFRSSSDVNNVITIYLQGNASEEGTADANFLLSTRRAVAVKNQLMELGVNPDLILLIPYGAENPVTSSQSTEADREKNRRVDIFVISQ